MVLPGGTPLGRKPAALPGSRQLGIGKQILERYPWWQFEPHQEWVQPLVEYPEYFVPYAAGIPGRCELSIPRINHAIIR